MSDRKIMLPIEKLLLEKWQTFDNRMMTLGEMDQQHLSNIYYYYKYVYTAHIGGTCLLVPACNLKELIQRVLNHRFNGQLLAYRPHVNFKFEMETLWKMGAIHGNNIIIEGKKIGEIITMDDFEKEVLEKEVD